MNIDSKTWRYSGHLFKEPAGHIYLSAGKDHYAIGLKAEEKLDQADLNDYGQKIASCLNACQGIENPQETIAEVKETLKSLSQMIETSHEDFKENSCQIKQSLKELLAKFHDRD